MSNVNEGLVERVRKWALLRVESTAFKFSSSCLGPLAYGLLGEVGKVKTENDSFMPLFTNVIKPFVGCTYPQKKSL